MPTFLRIIAASYLAYLVLSLLIITPLLNLLPAWYVDKTWGRELRTEWVILNPFKLSLDISRAELLQPDGADFAALGKSSVNLSLESLWQAGWVLDELALRDIALDLVQKADGSFNFSDMQPPSVEEAPPGEDSGTPGITVHELVISAQAISVTDKSRDTPYSSQWNDLGIHVSGLSTVIEDGRPYTIDLTGPNGGTLRWEGTVSLPQSSSDGQLSLSKLSMPTLWGVAEPWLALEVRDGRLSIEGDYSIDWSEGFNYRVSGGQVALTGIDIIPKDPQALPDTAVQLESLELRDIALDGGAQRLTLDGIAISGLELATWREGEEISLQRLFAVNLPDTDPAQQPPVPEANDEAGWSVALNTLELADSAIRWRSAITDPAELDIRPLAFSMRNINWPLSGETPMTLSLSINDLADIALDGTLALAEGDGTIRFELNGLPLPWFGPNLPERLNATVESGTFELSGDVALAGYSPQLINLGGAIRDFALQQGGEQESFTSWETVRIEGLSADMTDHRLNIDRLAIDNYTGRLHINEDGSINASKIMQEEVGEQAEEIAEELTQDKPWEFDLADVQVTDSEIDFMDKSLPIVFRTLVGEIEGEILGLSSDPNKVAKVEFRGTVDGYAPVTVDSNITPFDRIADQTLDVSFEGIDMALLTPYSATYAGYKIERGLLDVELHYTQQASRLKGSNEVRIDKLKLGEKIDSDRAVAVPLKLGLAILTDANGVINLKVPVSGDLEDPQFNLGGVITGAFFSAITKAVTAPFSLLAGLVGSEEDLQRLTFETGSSALREANREKLQQLAQAMTQRPKLSLVVTGRLSVEADKERMQKNLLKSQLREEGMPQEEIDKKGPAWDKAIARRYGALGLPDTDTPPSSREQYLAVARSMPVSEQELLDLAGDRAAAVKAFLVNEAGLAADRAVVGQSTIGGKARSFSGVELSIDG